MGVPFMDQIVKETRGQPYTMLVLCGLMYATYTLWTSSATAQDVKAVQAQISSINTNINRTALETQLKAVESELFQLNQQIADKTSSHKHVDPIYYSRVNELQIEKNEVERKLMQLK